MIQQINGIPNADPNFEIRQQLDGVSYVLEIRWLVRLGAFFLNVYEDDGTTLVLAGLRLVANWPVGSYNTGRRPFGALMVVDTSGRDEDPGLNDLGLRHQLWYIPLADMGLG